MRWILSLALMSVAVPAFPVTDPFDQDPTQSPDWELYQPVAGMTFVTDDGFWRTTIPPGINLDTWTAVDNGTQLRRTDMPEDFAIETRVHIVGAGDPTDPVNPPFFPGLPEPYLANLMVYFSQYDFFHFGPQQGTNLVVQRSGTGWLGSFDPFLQDLSLQIKKTGTDFTFSWRAVDTDPWTAIATVTALEQVQAVGYMFKTWGTLPTLPETYDWDYFKVDEVPAEAPKVTVPCPFPDPDTAWIGMPYVRALDVTGYPIPDVALKKGPEGMIYDPALDAISWLPDTFGAQAVEVEASSPEGTDVLNWNLSVEGPSSKHDEEFVGDPSVRTDYWELYQPQTGVTFSIDTLEPESTWWRLDVPIAGDFGMPFDTWTAVDNAVQLRHFLEDSEDFLIETRVRIDPDNAPPAATSLFLSGLMVYFSQFDLIHWNIGQERIIGDRTTNLFLERCGINDIAHGYVPGILQGNPVSLRVEKRCATYSFFYKGDLDTDWILAGTYRTDTPPTYVGLIMKTWGAGVAFSTEFDYFTFVKPGPRAAFTVTPTEGPEPLTVSVDATGASSPAGIITGYEWDFGDGATASGATAAHTYDENGTYVVKLTVTDATGDTGSHSKLVKVSFRSEDVSPWISEDIGAEPRLDAGTRLEAPDCLRVFATGSDLSGRADQFHFVYQKVDGDSSITARLSSVEWRSAVGPKVGVMAREDLTPGSRFASMVFTSLVLGEKFSFLRRETADGAVPLAKNSTEKFTVPDAWVKLERKGEELIGSYSLDGSTWNELSRVTLAGLPAEINLGIAAAAKDTETDPKEIEALLCEVKLEGGAPPKPVFRRGDSDSKGGVPNITDGIFVLNFLFLGGPEPPCKEAANADDKGDLNITDGIYILNYLFQGGPAPPAPGPEACGPDPDGSLDNIGCNSYPGEC